LGRTRWITAVLVLGAAGAAAVVAIAASPAPAGNRNPEVHLTAAPGLTQATYGQSIAYTSTAKNPGPSSFTRVQFRDSIPTTVSNGQTLDAQLVSASCSGKLIGREFVCDEVKLAKGATTGVTIVWRSPPAGVSADCPTTTPVCMTNQARWTIKEGLGDQPHSSGPDTVLTEKVATALLSANDPSKAGAFATAACTNPASPTLATNPAVGPGNQVATAVCATSLPNPGLVLQVNEVPRTPSDPGTTEVSQICVPNVGQSCAPGYTPWVFSPFATFTFRIAKRVEKVYHDGVKVSSKPGSDPRVLSISYDCFKNVTTVVATGSTNGSWVFG
jgi:uncharacterized repeat protein (TIGR01451 family)